MNEDGDDYFWDYQDLRSRILSFTFQALRSGFECPMIYPLRYHPPRNFINLQGVFTCSSPILPNRTESTYHRAPHPIFILALLSFPFLHFSD